MAPGRRQERRRAMKDGHGRNRSLCRPPPPPLARVVFLFPFDLINIRVRHWPALSGPDWRGRGFVRGAAGPCGGALFPPSGGPPTSAARPASTAGVSERGRRVCARAVPLERACGSAAAARVGRRVCSSSSLHGQVSREDDGRCQGGRRLLSGHSRARSRGRLRRRRPPRQHAPRTGRLGLPGGHPQAQLHR